MIIKSFFTLFIVFGSTLVIGQFKNYAKESLVWKNGMVQMDDGRVREGKINYNFVTETLKVKSQDEEKVYSANRIAYFELIDNDTTTYVSLPFDSHENGYSRFAFFKIEYQNTENLILSRNVFSYKENRNVAPATGLTYGQINAKIEKVTRRIYIGSEGKIFPVLIGKVNKLIGYDYGMQAPKKAELMIEQGEKYALRKEMDSRSEMEVKRYSLTDKNFVNTIYPQYKSQLNEYIKTNQLKFKSISDLVLVLERKIQLDNK